LEKKLSHIIAGNNSYLAPFNVKILKSSSPLKRHRKRPLPVPYTE